MSKRKPVRIAKKKEPAAVKEDPKKEKPELKEVKPIEVKPEEPKEEPKVDVDPYDAMPNVVDEPAVVFRLAMLDARHQAAIMKKDKELLEIQSQLRSIQLRQQQVVTENEAEIRKIGQMIKSHKDYIEETYKLSLQYYTYDDLTGELQKMPKTGGD